MIRKTIIFFVAVSLSLIIWQIGFVRDVTAPVYEKISQTVSETFKQKEVIEFPDNFELRILAKINEERAKVNKKPLSWSDDLAKAAKTRAVIIKNLDDFSGTKSGLTREKVYDLVNYNTTYFGDIYLYIIDPDESFLDKVLQNETEKETLLMENFTEVGVALADSTNIHEYYLLFGSRKPKVVLTPTTVAKAKVTWGGPDLWKVVNERRIQLGVGELSRKDELCTIASIRLNQLLDIGKLDGHAGFQPVLERSDLKWIAEKYNISEFLAQGYTTPEATVKGWENTLGHRALLAGGEYVWGCIYSQNTFSVAIVAY